MMSAYLHSVDEMLGELHERGFFADCSDLITDSRLLKGLQDVFIALPGSHFDPRNMADDLISKSLCGLVLVEYDEQRAYQSACVIPVLNLRDLLAQFACAYYGQPSQKLKLVAVTGTNGKTTVTRWLAQTLNFLGVKAGVIGTLGHGLPDALESYSGLTTPDVVGMHRILHQMVGASFEWVFVEASSIGLDQERLAGVRLVCAALTNFSQDHLDYHGNMANYGEAKLRLAKWPDLPLAVALGDDAFGVRFLQAAQQKGARAVQVGRSADAQVCLTQVQVQASGLQVSLSASGQDFTMTVPVLGAFNAENLALVFAVLTALGFDAHAVAEVLPRVSPAPGRMQQVSDSPCVLVDYAHTPDALQKVLLSLRELASARNGALIVLFGCGGDRDKSKRPLMGSIAAELADVVVMTSDNPRTESPERILDEIFAGVHAEFTHKVVVEVQRKAAIARCIGLAQANDVVLLAGKGHEAFQTIGQSTLPHSDFELAKQTLAQRSAA